LYVKNEGALAALAGLCAIMLLLTKRAFSTKHPVAHRRRYFLAVAFGLIPYLLWSFYKQQWNLGDGLEIGTWGSLVRIVSRVQDGSYIMILRGSFKQLESALLLVGFLLIAAMVTRKSIPRECLPALIATGLFGIGVVTIYLLTPFDLAEHFNSSIGRTMLSVNGCIFVACFFLLNALENTMVNA
jgi:hypothetical protein